MNAIDLLIRQHRTLEAALRAGLDAEASKRAPTVTRLADDLGKHMSSEEQVFYPAVRAHRTEDILLESLEEHLSLKRLLADLLELDPDGGNVGRQTQGARRADAPSSPRGGRAPVPESSEMLV